MEFHTQAVGSDGILQKEGLGEFLILYFNAFGNDILFADLHLDLHLVQVVTVDDYLIEGRLDLGDVNLIELVIALYLIPCPVTLRAIKELRSITNTGRGDILNIFKAFFRYSRGKSFVRYVTEFFFSLVLFAFSCS